MRRPALLLALLSIGSTAELPAQAPPAADLWRVAATSVAIPTPLQTGATGMFWNPAVVGAHEGLAVGADAVLTSEVLGLSGLLAATSFSIHGPLRAGVVAGRVEIRDLVRTTTSPDGTDGTIPVYEQFAGLDLGLSHGWLSAGVGLALHESRFDVISRSGFTIDAGIQARPLDRLTVAASTHLLPLDLSKNANTEYLAAAGFTLVDRRRADGMRLFASARYGVSYQARGAWEHIVGLGAELAERVVVDVALASESSVAGRVWRPSMGLGIRFGGYTVEFGHGLGANDLGGTTRVGLDIRFGP